ncbi:winged helix-turn-helix domain-containing protein [Sulfolobus acidocaldarius]|uniref:Conserved Archaeal HTH domain protein n=4 Tax=Sulfolobus acidocaldarius TaxID=2285 RepID=Q4J9J1_SULAC|nr:HTH DNA-binding domain-containing protein [Sulfolobus acidocaldarius]AHC51482.1 molybdenum transporter [Sulfolobus acidocaldarius SUSAZ]AAY80539.1 conserved Archaeal HTH domain protein [Sulfolobus acidocaldarius DSM 639]AGE71128.1 HTH DNA-binding domain-containing protein [Sulfolobus acidocaldarius N8]AGE73398.1 HTH DNA-binding domain-containing protein [Sulfolobus acidocaldarius Ron12/I]ALU28598.1 DNA-binding protein [Sulfolobus acidocaldarius]
MKIRFKLWLETDDGRPVLGKGGINLLKEITLTGSISKSAKSMNVSYKFAWEYLKKVNEILGGIDMKKGGKGAGGTILSEKLVDIVNLYEEAQKEVQNVLDKYEKRLNEILEKSD